MTAIVLAVNNGIVTTTSNEVAVNFGKRHDHVLRAIDNLECSPEFTGRNFGASDYLDPTGRTLRAFTLTRDGFAFLCMGFTGKEAAQWKEKYIAAFNAMEAKLKQGVSLPDLEADIQKAHAERLMNCVKLAGEITHKMKEALFADLLQNGKAGTSPIQRFLAGFGHDMTPYAIPLEEDACVVSLSRLAEMIATPGELLPSNDELANLAKACIERLALRRGFQPAILAT